MHYVGTAKVIICHKCINIGSDQLLLGVSTRTGVQAMLDVDRISAWGADYRTPRWRVQFTLCYLIGKKCRDPHYVWRSN